MIERGFKNNTDWWLDSVHRHLTKSLSEAMKAGDNASVNKILYLTERLWAEKERRGTAYDHKNWPYSLGGEVKPLDLGEFKRSA